jgi:UDP-2,3-diacylglucosamine pyrophosphatase LpxH
MPDIKYVIVSDLHFGAQNSLLTKLTENGLAPDFTAPSPSLLSFVESLKILLSKNDSKEKPVLILLGDILELALCETHEAGMVFDRFVDLILKEKEELFSHIFYIPGNHDHHLWEIARESQYLRYIERMDDKNNLPPMWHTTNIFIENHPHPTHCDFMNSIIQNHNHLKEYKVKVAYPNFGIKHKSKDKAMVVHHGHYLEDIYLLMSKIKTYVFPDQKIPEDIWDIQKENFAWIDFFWSTMGRSGQVGEGVELIYDKMSDDKKFSELLQNISEKVAEKIKENENKDTPNIFKKLFRFFVRFLPFRKIETIIFKLLKFTAGNLAKQERMDKGGVLSDEIRENLKNYLNHILFRQLKRELKNDPPSELSFVFGHTHKPFFESHSLSNYSKPIHVYNTGGWVIDTVNKKESYGGAMILVDEELNICPVQIFRESDSKEINKVAIIEFNSKDPFQTKIQSIINSNQDFFSKQSEIISKEIDLRIINLKAKINK